MSRGPAPLGQPGAAFPTWLVIATARAGRSGLHSYPAERFLAVCEGMHTHRLAVAEGEDIRQAYVLPLLAFVGPNSSVDENHDAVAGGNEFFRLAVHLRHGFSRLRQICLCPRLSVVGTAAGKLRRLDPLNLGIKGLYCGRNIAPV